MTILKSKRFRNEFKGYISYIRKDSKIRAYNFKSDILQKIQSLSNMPYKFRQSNKFDNENIRDLIYKGYVIPYKIDEQNSNIIILGIYKENSWN